MSLPCGTCIGCRAARATEWARRCVHEARSWDHNCFLTLTYSDDHVPVSGYLDPEALTKFIKRLRKNAHSPGSCINRDRRYPPRYFACGEYGELSGRPHYHALLFNCGFSDTSRVGADLWESEVLKELWPFGKHALGTATGASANYIAQYSMKKQGFGKDDCDANGVWRPAPFLRMSLKPAIGLTWLSEYSGDLSQGYMVSEGRPCRIPRTYMRTLKESEPALAESIDFRAYSHRTATPTDANEPARLEAAEVIHERLKSLNEARSL